jgi:hypothetical protein
MDKGSSSQIQKQSKRIKKTVNGLNPDLPLEAEGSVELSEHNSRSDTGEDNDGEDNEVQDGAAEFPRQHKRRSRNKPFGGRSRGKGDIPKTFITAVLEELSEDVISEPTRHDAGKEVLVTELSKSRSRLFNPFANAQVLMY